MKLVRNERYIAVAMVIGVAVIAAYLGNIWGYLSTCIGMYLVEAMYV